MNTEDLPIQEETASREVVQFEQAVKEVAKWLDYKKIPPEVRVASQKSIVNLAFAISRGELILMENLDLKYPLKFPLLGEKGSVIATELVFKPRLSIEDVNEQQAKAMSNSGKYNVYVIYASALTKQPLTIINKIDTTDYSLLQDIVTFFL